MADPFELTRAVNWLARWHWRTWFCKTTPIGPVDRDFESTGADSPSQNRVAENSNDKLAVWTRTLLYGVGLPTKYWSSALLHAVYLHNCLVHTVTECTHLESSYGTKPYLAGLKMFGSWASLKTFGSRKCLKCNGHQCSKLDCHDFTGIFISYTALD
jgi:hypothetical protein